MTSFRTFTHLLQIEQQLCYGKNSISDITRFESQAKLVPLTVTLMSDTRKPSCNADLSYADLTERLKVSTVIYLPKAETAIEQHVVVTNGK